MNTKEDLHLHCEKLLQSRIAEIKSALQELVDGAKNDSKSTAGDKHETARAMMQIEQEKLANQLNLILSQQQSLQRLHDVQPSDKILNGSLVKTNVGWIYISIPIGRVAVNDLQIMCLTAQSPLGTKLLGKAVGERVQINAVDYLIEEIC